MAMYRPLNDHESRSVYNYFKQTHDADELYISARLYGFDLLAKRYDLTVMEVVSGNEKMGWDESVKKKYMASDSDVTPPDQWDLEEIFSSRTYDDSDRYNRLAQNEPPSLHAWFFGNDEDLSKDHRQLKMKFFNSKRYRRNVLEGAICAGQLTEDQLHDLNAIKAYLALLEG